MKRLITFAAFLSAQVSVTAHARPEYGPGPGGLIPQPPTSADKPGVFTSVITVADVGPIISLDSVTLNFGNPHHRWAGNLEVILTAPNGDNVHLFSRVVGEGGTDSSDLDGEYIFVNSGGADFSEAAASVHAYEIIPPGTYNRSTTAPSVFIPPPDFDTYDVFVGDQITGEWILTINDWDTEDDGGLVSWSFSATIPGPSGAILLLFGIRRLRRRRYN